MKVYKTQAEVEKDIVDWVLRIEGNVTFECNISIEADIKARNINAWDISYYAFCNVYEGIECISIKGMRIPHSQPICLEGELIIKKVEVKEYSMDEIAKALGVDVSLLRIKEIEDPTKIWV